MDMTKHLSSRKFTFGIVTSLLVIAVALLGIAFPAIMTQLPIIVGGLTGNFAVYATGNVIDSKNDKASTGLSHTDLNQIGE